MHLARLYVLAGIPGLWKFILARLYVLAGVLGIGKCILAELCSIFGGSGRFRSMGYVVSLTQVRHCGCTFIIMYIYSLFTSVMPLFHYKTMYTLSNILAHASCIYVIYSSNFWHFNRGVYHIEDLVLKGSTSADKIDAVTEMCEQLDIDSPQCIFFTSVRCLGFFGLMLSTRQASADDRSQINLTKCVKYVEIGEFLMTIFGTTVKYAFR